MCRSGTPDTWKVETSQRLAERRKRSRRVLSALSLLSLTETEADRPGKGLTVLVKRGSLERR